MQPFLSFPILDSVKDLPFSAKNEPKFSLLPPELLALIIKELDLGALLQLYAAIYAPIGSVRWEATFLMLRTTIKTKTPAWIANEAVYALVIKHLRQKLGTRSIKNIFTALAQTDSPVYTPRFGIFEVDEPKENIGKYNLYRLLLTNPIFYANLLKAIAKEKIEIEVKKNLKYDSKEHVKTAVEKPITIESFFASRLLLDRYHQDIYTSDIKDYAKYNSYTDISRLLFLAVLTRQEIAKRAYQEEPTIKWLEQTLEIYKGRKILETQNVEYIKQSLEIHKRCEVLEFTDAFHKALCSQKTWIFDPIWTGNTLAFIGNYMLEKVIKESDLKKSLGSLLNPTLGGRVARPFGESALKRILEELIKKHALKEWLNGWPFESASIEHSTFLVFALLLNKCFMLGPEPSFENIPIMTPQHASRGPTN